MKSTAMKLETSTWVDRAGELAREFGRKAADLDTAGQFVTENYQTLKKEKFFSISIPRELGGGGASYADLSEVIRSFGRECGSTALAYSMHTHPVAVNVFKHLRGDEKATGTLKKIAANELAIAGTGANDWLGSSGQAVAVDGGYKVSARKHFVSGGPGAQVFVTSAAHESEEGTEVLHFAVPFSSPGITHHDNWDTLGMRATGSNDISMDDVFVPEEAVVARRPAGAWHPMWNVIIPTAMPLIMSAYVGIADAARDIAVKSAARHADELAGPLGELLNQHTLASVVLADMIRINDNHGFTPGNELASEVFTRKTLVSTAVMKTVDLAAELVGGAAFFRGHPMERITRDIRACHFHPLPYRRQQKFSGKVALGLDPIG